MSSSYYKLQISDRVDLKKKGSKMLRKKGLIPGVLYYAGEDNINIEIDKSALFHAMQSGQRIFEIEQKGESQYTMIKELQYHPVTDQIIHVDLMRVRRSEKMTIVVPLTLVGDSKGVKEGGLLSQSINQLEISCFPTDVPEQIELNVEELELGSSMNVSDIKLENDDIEIITDKEVNIVTVSQVVEEDEVEMDDTGTDSSVEDSQSETSSAADSEGDSE
jgi:large subunit ribosomal protein L25